MKTFRVHLLALLALAATITACPEPAKVGDFTLALTPVTGDIMQNNTLSVAVNLTRINNFADAVNLTLANPPQGLSSDPLTIGAGSSSGTLVIHAATSAALGAVKLNINALGGNLTKTGELNLNVILQPVKTGDFTFKLMPTSSDIVRNGTLNIAVSLTRTGNFADAVSLNLSNPPTGISASPLSIDAASLSGTLMIQASSSAALGALTLTVNASGGSLNKTANLNLTVTQIVVPALSLTVDSSLIPAQATLDDGTGTPRPVGRMVGASGIPMDFVLDELVVATDDMTKLNAFVNKWGGSILESTDKVGSGLRIHHIHLSPNTAQVNQILIGLNASAPDMKGDFRTSNDSAAKLLAVALEEANKDGITVTPDFVMTFNDIATGVSTEAPMGNEGYVPNAFNFPYMNSGSAQDVGVGAAWQALSRANKLGNKVPIMILDRGFANPTTDYPDVHNVIGIWGEPNNTGCGTGACPWHATAVTTAAMGHMDDGFGASGPAAPIGQLVAVPFGADFFQVVSVLGRVAHGFISANIINMSFSFELDLGWDIAVRAACLFTCPSASEMLGGVTAGVAATGKLIFAAAGNAGKDVDNGLDVIEGSTTIPCELPGIICVGGMAHNATTRDPGSNFGSKTGDSSVDIYGPFRTWTGPDPDNTTNTARLLAGTSLSSPFVAGVAALVWAADPTLSANQVWTILQETAHVGGLGTTGNQKRINALGAIQRVLGLPPTLALSRAGFVSTASLNRNFQIDAIATDPDGPSCCAITWNPAPTSDAFIIGGRRATYRFNTAGDHVITATATDTTGNTVTSSITISVINNPPIAIMSLPVTTITVFRGQPVFFRGFATDANQGLGPNPEMLPCENLTWTDGNSSDVGFPRIGSGTAPNCEFSYTFTTNGTRAISLTATDSQGLTNFAPPGRFINVIDPPVNLPPNINLGVLPATTYTTGYRWDVAIPIVANATDPENNTPITYRWTATTYLPNSGTVFAGPTVVQDWGSSGDLNWTPSLSNSAMFGTFADFGNACYDGQTVTLVLEAMDSLGNISSSTFPNITVFRCIII